MVSARIQPGAFVVRPENLSQNTLGIVYGMFTWNRPQNFEAAPT